MNNWVHPYQPGDEIWVKDWKKEQFQPIWTGPHMVILRTPTADKVTDIPWIYHPRVKKAAASCDEDPWKAVWDSKSLLKVQFQRQRPSPMKDTEPCSLLWKLTSQHTAEVWQNQYNIVKEKKKEAWRFFILAPATLQQLTGQRTAEAWGFGYQNIDGFSSSTLASIPNRYYCCAFRYRTNQPPWLRWFYRIGEG